MTQRHERQHLRGSRPFEVVEGYLSDTLDAATVSGGSLTTTTVDGYVFDDDGAGNWVDTGGTVELLNRSESLDGERGYYFIAFWTGKDWRLFWVDCDATELTLPGD